MRKYKQKVPLVSPLKIAAAALCAAIITAMIVVISGCVNEWHIIFGGVAAALFICGLFIMIGAEGRYGYSNSCIKIMFRSLVYKKLDYAWFSSAVISNASYNNGFGYGISRNIPMQYRVKDNKGHTKVTFPFITLHTSAYPIDKIKESMNSRDLFMLNNNEMYCLGICWFDSLEELLKYTKVPIYVLEDVYLRYKEQFGEIFTLYRCEAGRLYIVSDCKVEYSKYVNSGIKQNNG